jgi:hypothetical protein
VLKVREVVAFGLSLSLLVSSNAFSFAQDRAQVELVRAEEDLAVKVVARMKELRGKGILESVALWRIDGLAEDEYDRINILLMREGMLAEQRIELYRIELEDELREILKSYGIGAYLYGERLPSAEGGVKVAFRVVDVEGAILWEGTITGFERNPLVSVGKWVALGGASASGVGAVITYLLSEAAYQNYLKAEKAEDIERYRTEVDTYDVLTIVLGVLLVVGIGTAVYLFVVDRE